MTKASYIHLAPDGEFIFCSKNKGSNPERKREPSINCPNCGKFMYSVYDKHVKNDILCYDMTDPKYQNYPREHIRVCSKCHHRIGMIYLDAKLRLKLGLPLQHQCHEKIVI